MSEHTPTATATGDQVPVTAPAPSSAVAVVDLAAQLDTLRLVAGRTVALADVTLESYDHADWSGADLSLVERTAHLLGAIAEAAVAVVSAVDRFRGFIADQHWAEVNSDDWW